MNCTSVFQEPTVALHKESGRQSFGGLLHLRIGESKPYLAHLTRRKETVYDFNIGAQESDILHARLQRLGSPRPHAGALYIHTDEVLIGKHTSQPHCILSTTTTQFQYNRIIVLEKLLMPVSLHVKRNIIHRRIRIFKNMRIPRHIGKLL